MRKAAAPTCSRSRHASSTSAARRRRPTSAPIPACALAFTIHLTLLGESGLRRLARINHANAVALAERLAAIPGVTLLNDTFFNEFTFGCPGMRRSSRAAGAEGRARRRALLASRSSLPELADLFIVASTEANSEADRDAFVAALSGACVRRPC